MDHLSHWGEALIDLGLKERGMGDGRGKESHVQKHAPRRGQERLIRKLYGQKANKYFR